VRLSLAHDEPAHRRLRRLARAAARLVLEILSAVRDAVGRDLAIGVRLCGDERIDRGTTITDALAVAQMVEAQGCADYLKPQSVPRRPSLVCSTV